MRLVDRNSLGGTIDALNEAFFFGRDLTKSQRTEAGRWIVGRQGLRGSYAGMFAPTSKDLDKGIRLFTGERIATRAGVGHVLGEEACRAMILLNVPGKQTRETLKAASAEMICRTASGQNRKAGMYCCGKCTAALWRHLAVGGLAKSEALLAAGLKTLKSRRTGDGRWRVFPFYYTLLALSEIDLPAATKELRYVAPVCERLLNRSATNGRYNKRRRALAERVLVRC